MPPDDDVAKFARSVARLAQRLAQSDFPTGDHAALRRMDPREGALAPLALHRLLAEADIDDASVRRIQRWALIVHCLALARGRHDRNVPTGKGLHEIGVTEARLNQLLSSDEEVLFDLLPRLARRIGAQAKALDWVPLARIASAPEHADKARLLIARAYARAQAI